MRLLIGYGVFATAIAVILGCVVAQKEKEVSNAGIACSNLRGARAELEEDLHEADKENRKLKAMLAAKDRQLAQAKETNVKWQVWRRQYKEWYSKYQKQVAPIVWPPLPHETFIVVETTP